jgi:hypothetical protein
MLASGFPSLLRDLEVQSSLMLLTLPKIDREGSQLDGRKLAGYMTTRGGCADVCLAFLYHLNEVGERNLNGHFTQHRISVKTDTWSKASRGPPFIAWVCKLWPRKEINLDRGDVHILLTQPSMSIVSSSYIILAK